MEDAELKKLGYARKEGKLALLEPGSVAGAPQKVLEAARMAAELGLAFEAQTKQALAGAAKRLASVGPAELGPAWRAFAETPKKRAAFEMLDLLGGVQALMPEVAAMKGVEQPPQWHPEGDVWVHTLLCLEYLGEADALTTTATILHDVGKPPTFEVADRIRFTKHDALGARLAAGIARKLGFDKDEVAAIEWMVRSHMKFKHVREMRPGRLEKFVLDPRFEVLAAVVRADCLASHGDVSDVEFALQARKHALHKAQEPEPLLRGKDLIEMGFAPGPRFGEVLKEIENLRKTGKIHTSEQATFFAKKNFHES